MAKIYVKYIGEFKGDVQSPGEDHIEKGEFWFPGTAPENVELIATDEYPDEIEFRHKVYEGKYKIGPFKLSLGVDLKFKGKIEYWKVKDA